MMEERRLLVHFKTSHFEDKEDEGNMRDENGLINYEMLRRLIFLKERGINNPAGKYWFPGRPEDVSLQRPQDVP